MATIKISSLTEKATMSGTEEVLINDSGTSKKFSTQRFLDVKTGAETAETNAASSATSASTSASTATTKASTATAQAVISTAQAVISTTKASDASTSATESATSATSAAASLDEFDDTYLGAKASNPSVDNDGNSIATGALYFNTTDDEVKVYDGVSWLVSYNAFSGITDTATSTKLAVSNSGIDVTGTVISTGNGVGIKLDGTANTTRSIFFRNTTTANPAQVYSDGSLRLFTEDANTSITFLTNSNGTTNERMRITSTGVGIGKSPGAVRLDVEIASSGYLAGQFLNTHATGYGVVLGGGSTSSQYALDVRNNGGSSSLFRVRSDGNVGIGVSSPTEILSITDSGATPTIYIDGNSTPAKLRGRANRTSAGQHITEFVGKWNNTDVARVVIAAGDDTTNKDDGRIVLYTAASGSMTEAMRIEPNGNVGIGKVPGSVRLDVEHTQSGQLVGNFLNTHATGYGVVLGGGSTSSQYALDVRNNGGSSSLFRVRSDGNVGIGTSSPATSLHIETASGGVARVARSSSPANYLQLEHDGTNGTITNSANNLIVRNNGSERMRISSTGNVGIGQSAPAFKLSVGDGTEADVAINIKVTTSGTSRILFSKAGANGRGLISYKHSDEAMVFSTNDTEHMTITATGDVEMDGDLAVDGVVKSGFGLFEHANTITSNYTITSGNNALTAGPITISSGVSITIPSGSTWVIT